ncbi:hypothetical protein BH09BAC3_BH09BAC3_00710 [soil metagenome]
MAKNKTTDTGKDVNEFINKVADETKRDDAFQLIEIFKSQTGFDAKMWGPSIIGFGFYHYKYESGHEGDAPLTGFSPRKAATVLYITGFPKREEMLKKLGKYKVGKGCIYVKRLEDIERRVLEKMIVGSVKEMKKKYP